MVRIDNNERTRRCVLAAVILTVTLGGCAHRRGEVGMQRMDPDSIPMEAGSKVTLKAQEAFSMPMLLGEHADQIKSPEYPEDLLKQKLPPMTVCVDLIISETGDVTAVQPFTYDPKCASPSAAGYAGFLRSVDAAARQWRFLPALMCRFPAHIPPDPDKCRAKDAARSGIDVKPIPVTLTYRFDFRQVDGRGVVRRE